MKSRSSAPSIAPRALRDGVVSVATSSSMPGALHIEARADERIDSDYYGEGPRLVKTQAVQYASVCSRQAAQLIMFQKILSPIWRDRVRVISRARARHQDGGRVSEADETRCTSLAENTSVSALRERRQLFERAASSARRKSPAPMPLPVRLPAERVSAEVCEACHILSSAPTRA